MANVVTGNPYILDTVTDTAVSPSGAFHGGKKSGLLESIEVYGDSLVNKMWDKSVVGEDAIASSLAGHA